MEFNFDELKNPQDVSDMFTAEDMEKNKAFGAVASIPILFWVPLVANSESSYGKFAANQGLIMLIVDIALGLVSGLLSAIFGIIPFIGGILAALISLVFSVVELAGFLFLLITALQGKAKYLPLVGDKFQIIK